MGKLVAGGTRFLLLCALLLALPALVAQGAESVGVSGEATDVQTQAVAGSSFSYQLLKETVTLWADGRGDVILERKLQNTDIVNWSNTTWYFDWPSGIYTPIRAWDVAGPLIFTVSPVSGTRINITVNFRRPIQPGEIYHFSLAITIAKWASITGYNGRAYWYTQPGSPVQELIRAVSFPSN